MRTEKFDSKGFGDDIRYAFNENSLSEKLDLIDVIVAEVCGENDEYEWYWILQMKDGTFSWAKGGCDYTGWDCRSSAEIKEGFKTPEEAIEALELAEFEHRKSIKKVLLKQIKSEMPFALYQELD